MDFETLERIALTAYGQRWGAALAESLTRLTGRNISASQVHHWKSGQRPVPDWVGPAMLGVLNDDIAGKLDLARRLREEANAIEDKLFEALDSPLNS